MNGHCSLLLMVCVTLMAVGCGRPTAIRSVMTPEEGDELQASLAELESALTKHSPFIHSKLAAPASEEGIAALREGLGGVEVQCLETWYRWHNGCVDNLTDFLPLGRMLSISEALDDREMIQEYPFVDSKRKSAIKILEDGAGDGFFLDVSSSEPRVFYHMLEDPFPRDYGALRHFAQFIARVHSSGVASLDENGMVDFDLVEYDRIESDYLRKLETR